MCIDELVPELHYLNISPPSSLVGFWQLKAKRIECAASKGVLLCVLAGLTASDRGCVCCGREHRLDLMPEPTAESPDCCEKPVGSVSSFPALLITVPLKTTSIKHQYLKNVEVK